jgi:hypothetical protein
MRQNSVFSWLAIIIAILFFAKLLLPTGTDVPTHATKMKHLASHEMGNLCAALQAFRSEYGQLPSGFSSNILETLLGNNARKIVFLNIDHRRITGRGEYLDPWKNPYHFDTSDADQPRVYSNGPNKRDDFAAERSDDIASWRSR